MYNSTTSRRRLSQNSRKLKETTTSFDPNDANPYHLYLVEALKPPNSLDLYSNTKETLEYLLSFKTSIIPSLAEEADIVKPCIYHSCIHLFKPSISFKND